jgi:Delta3-Delta2-enoyl-CoA isomerase
MIEIQDHGNVREIRLARPPANALETEMLRALIGAIRAAPEAGATAIVLSGRPGMFSAGLDVPLLLQFSRAGMLEFWRQFFGAQQAIAASAVPIVAALTGHSPAGGAVLAMHCDYRVMAEGKYKIGLNEVQVGLYPGPIIHGALKRLVGARQAERLLSGGQLLSGTEALDVGFIDRLVPETEVVPVALEWARGMAALPPRALAHTRKLSRADLVALTAELTDRDFEAMNAAWYSEETQATMQQLVARLKK